ncbi:MAG: ABC transporter transmembrane domain-containing protein, partial [Candidatus Zixiibacteriota bacterium]
MSKSRNNNKGRFRVITRNLKQYRWYIIIGGLSVLAANGLMMINPYLMKIAFDKLENKEPASHLINIALLIVLFAIASGVFRFLMRRTIIWMSRKFEYNLRGELLGHLLKLNPTFYYNNRTGDIMARMTNDIEAVRMMAGPGVMHIVSGFVSAAIAITLMLLLSPKLTMYSLIPLPLLSVVVNRVGIAI